LNLLYYCCLRLLLSVEGLFIKDPPVVGTMIADVLDPMSYIAKPPDDIPGIRQYALVLKSGVYVVPPSLSPPIAALWIANTPTPEMLANPNVFEGPWVLGEFVETVGIVSIQIKQIFNRRKTKDELLELFVPYSMHGVTASMDVHDAVINRTKYGVVASVRNPKGGFKKCLRTPSAHGHVTSAYRLHPASDIINKLPGLLSNITRKRNAKQWWNKIVDRNGTSPGAVYIGTGLHVEEQNIVAFLVVSNSDVYVIADGDAKHTNISEVCTDDLPQIFPQYFKLIAQKICTDNISRIVKNLERSTR
jgi:hypothetical protein